MSQTAAETTSYPLETASMLRRTVLCVEDNPANLHLIESILLRRPDVRLLAANDGMDGIQQARRARPDAILMDINLPGISGLQALKVLLADVLTAHIPVIALSANAMPNDVKHGLQAGFFRYLTKPIKVSELLETLELAFMRNPQTEHYPHTENSRQTEHAPPTAHVTPTDAADVEDTEVVAP